MGLAIHHWCFYQFHSSRKSLKLAIPYKYQMTSSSYPLSLLVQSSVSISFTGLSPRSGGITIAKYHVSHHTGTPALLSLPTIVPRFCAFIINRVRAATSSLQRTSRPAGTSVQLPGCQGDQPCAGTGIWEHRWRSFYLRKFRFAYPHFTYSLTAEEDVQSHRAPYSGCLMTLGVEEAPHSSNVTGI